MKTFHIDVNADVGEGIGNEALIMPYISSCNIACGAHAGDMETMRAVVQLAKQYGVKVGAHPAFPDRTNFGRVRLFMSEANLLTSLQQQINILKYILKESAVHLHHVKPHGALYNLAAIDHKIAEVIVNLMKQLPKSVKLYVPYNSVVADLATQHNISILYEAFADRNYNSDLTLVSRQESNALITSENDMLDHIYTMVVNQKVKTVQGDQVPIKADTFCIHGDNEQAANQIQNLKERLATKGIIISNGKNI